jgi:hypothetical protein
VTPDSRQSKMCAGACGFPGPNTYCSEADPEIFAPRAVIALAVAIVSSHSNGLMIFVVPLVSRAVNRARCVWAFEPGAIM